MPTNERAEITRDIVQLRQRLTELIARHEIARARYTLNPEPAQPAQVVGGIVVRNANRTANYLALLAQALERLDHAGGWLNDAAKYEREPRAGDEELRP